MATKSEQQDKQIFWSDRELRRHVWRLRLTTLAAYRNWCAVNGFSRKIDKTSQQRRRERDRFDQQRAIDAMMTKRRETRRGENQLLDICRSDAHNDNWRDSIKAFYKSACDAFPAGPATELNFRTLKRLIAHLLKCKAKFLDGSPYYQRLGDRPGNSALEALPLIVSRYRNWIRPLDAWRPTSHSPRRQFKSLLEHLFVRYGEMPEFLDQVWLFGSAEQAESLRPIYLHVAAGLNLASCELMPLTYTKKMAHHFLSAPSDTSIEQALRWGEVKGLGGDDQLARAVMNTRLTVDFRNHNFWRLVLQWLIRYREVRRTVVSSIIDYIQFQRFVPQYLLAGDGHQQAAAPREPNFTMRGRTPETLLRQVKRWHETAHETYFFGVHDWRPCGIRELELVEETPSGELTIWTIHELLNSRLLVQEGAAMNHCVATYIDLCQQGQSSIWSLQRETAAGKTRALTIEVRPHQRQISEFSGRYNRDETRDELRVLRHWAAREKLQMPSWWRKPDYE